MKYRDKGALFCNEINTLLKQKCPKTSFVTGGGYAYDSTKYSDGNTNGDFDFMIVYDNPEDVVHLITELKTTNFEFEDNYLDLDLKLLNDRDIDIIRLSGNYMGTKSTINLVPLSLIEDICNLKRDRVIKKIAHNRNTSLFFAYGSDSDRIIVNFISPSFVTDDEEDHYIHLDFSCLEKNQNIYFGILADAILKGFNQNYDNLDFEKLRQKLIRNINSYFKENNIDTSNYINMFANNSYFPDYLKDMLLEEFKSYGIVEGKNEAKIHNEPIIFSADFNSSYDTRPFNFINNKPYNMSFIDYIKKMQNTEYERQYLIDAIGKFYGYLISGKHSDKCYDKRDILSEMSVYGTNDVYLSNAENYNIESIIDSIIQNLLEEKDKYNNELVKHFLLISAKFLSILSSKDFEEVLKEYGISQLIGDEIATDKMNIGILKRLSNFNEVGTYHNLTSKVMPNYTKIECDFLGEMIGDNKNKKILDIMCGYGRIANQLKQNGYKNICGIDSEEYSVFNIPKDFTYIYDEFLRHDFDEEFDFAYSLYNCYNSNDNLYDTIMKAHSVLGKNGQLIIDCFNKDWRDSVDPFFEKVLYEDDDYRLVVNREYNVANGKEKTVYRLYYKSIIIREYEFDQKFFDRNEVLELINTSKWNCEILDSSTINSRTNSQKHILVLRRKDEFNSNRR